MKFCLNLIELRPSLTRMLSGRQSSYCISYSDVATAYEVIRPYAHRTPIMQCSTINKLCGKNLFLKCENLQKTGSFKIRGAINAVHSANQADAKPTCVVTHSSGNHGQAIAKAAQLFNTPAYIVMPSNAPECKKDAVKGYGGIVVECIPTEQGRIDMAEKVCAERGGHFIHASQTPAVMAGQGTMAMEMLERNPDLDAIVAPVGGGGMISGIAIAAKHIKPSIKIYAAEPEMANDCFLSKQNDRLTPLDHTPKTIADGVKVNLGQNAWLIVRDLVDDVITVSEEEILKATKLVWERAKLVIEPTSGVGIAAVIGKKFATARGNTENVKNVGVVLCGGNADIASVAKLLSEINS